LHALDILSTLSNLLGLQHELSMIHHVLNRLIIRLNAQVLGGVKDR
jgi:hypothetical protein